MPSYTLKEGTCSVCGSDYTGLICDEEPSRNVCPKHRDGTAAVVNAQSLRYFSATPYFDTGLGLRVKSRRERQRIMRERNLVEVGDYNPKYIMDDIKPAKPWEAESDGPDDDFMEIWRSETERSEQPGEEL